MKNKICQYQLFMICILFSAPQLCAQQLNYRFEHISEEHGLSHDVVTSIHQDQEGFMWFGTVNGLNKYDGYHFSVIRYDPNNPQHSLRHNSISDIHEDRDGRLWVTTHGGGFHEVDKYNGDVKRHEIKPLTSFEWNYLTSIYEDQDENLWVCGFGGLALFDRDKEEFTLYPAPGKPTTGKAPGVFSIAQDSSGRYWIGSSSGLYQFTPETGEFEHIDMGFSIDQQDFWCNYLLLDHDETLWIGTDIGVLGREGEGLFRVDTRSDSLKFERYNPDGSISKKMRWNGIYEDTQKYIWVRGSEGLHRIDKKNDQVINFQYDPMDPKSLSHENVESIYQDRNEILWIGTHNGINKANVANTNFHTYQLIPAHASDVHDENSVSVIMEDQNGTIWLGNSGSVVHGNPRGGFYQFDTETEEIKYLSTQEAGLADNQILSIYEGKNQQLWVGTATALHLFNPKTNKFNAYPSEIPVWTIDQDKTGVIWFGGKTGLASFNPDKKKFVYYRYNPKDTTGLKGLFVDDVLVAKDGNIWAGTSSGIACLNPETGTFRHMQASTQPSPQHLNDNTILALYQDEKEVIWIGTRMGGLNRYDPQTQTFEHFTTKEGLPGNTVISILGNGRGLWLGTNKGISHFDFESNTFRNYDINDGLPSNKIGPIASRSDGQIMFGSINGFTLFHPDSIQSNTTKPPVYISGLQVMEEEREVPVQAVELPHDENILSFNFVALNYDAPEKNQYAYMLEGVDKDWVSSNDLRVARYTNLSPGEYTFRVKASNNDGVWNEEGASLQLTILPPWWQTTGAYILYSLMAIGLLLGLRQYTVKRERLKHELNLQRMEAEKMHTVDQMKSRFFANISHEFRTPLTLIMGPLEKYIQQTETSSKDHQNFRMMRRNARRLLHLINQLLDLSKLEAGKMQLQATPQPIQSFLQPIGMSFSTLAERKQVIYHFRYPKENPVLYFDADKLEKIITNLLSNAFKFTPAGEEITFTARLQPKKSKTKSNGSNPKQVLELEVKDSGAGMDEEQVQHIFQRFYQAHNAHDSDTEGSGIGLSLVKELAELHGGEITVTSQRGAGSCFTVRLPLQEADFAEFVSQPGREVEIPVLDNEAESEPESPGEGEASSDAPLLLVVEDNADVRAFICENLKSTYRLLEAANGREGYEKAVEHIPDLILSDVMMPEMDGVALCNHLKADEKTSHVPVILLTAKASGGDRIEGLQTGADDYIVKPFETHELQVRINNLIENRRRLREQFSREILLQPAAVKITSADEQFLQQVMGVIEANMANFNFGEVELRREMRMSKTQLYRKMKGLTNHSPGDFIQMMQLKRAAEMLAAKAGNVGEISFAVGFRDHSYFSRRFHKQYGMTPTEYAASVAK